MRYIAHWWRCVAAVALVAVVVTLAPRPDVANATHHGSGGTTVGAGNGQVNASFMAGFYRGADSENTILFIVNPNARSDLADMDVLVLVYDDEENDIGCRLVNLSANDVGIVDIDVAFSIADGDFGSVLLVPNKSDDFFLSENKNPTKGVTAFIRQTVNGIDTHTRGDTRFVPVKLDSKAEDKIRADFTAGTCESATVDRPKTKNPAPSKKKP